MLTGLAVYIESLFLLKVNTTRGIAPAQARSCRHISCFISIFVRVIVAVNFAFWVDHCFLSFLLL